MDFQLTETYFTLDRIHPLGVLVLLAVAVVAVVPFWPLFRKAGFAGPLSLLMLIPGFNILLLYVVAFTPTHKASQEN